MAAERRLQAAAALASGDGHGESSGSIAAASDVSNASTAAAMDVTSGAAVNAGVSATATTADVGVVQCACGAFHGKDSAEPAWCTIVDDDETRGMDLDTAVPTGATHTDENSPAAADHPVAPAAAGAANAPPPPYVPPTMVDTTDSTSFAAAAAAAAAVAATAVAGSTAGATAMGTTAAVSPSLIPLNSTATSATYAAPMLPTTGARTPIADSVTTEATTAGASAADANIDVSSGGGGGSDGGSSNSSSSAVIGEGADLETTKKLKAMEEALGAICTVGIASGDDSARGCIQLLSKSVANIMQHPTEAK